MELLIYWIEFYAVSIIFQPCNSGDYDQLWNFEVSLDGPHEPTLLRNPEKRATGVVILETAHHLTTQPTDIKHLMNIKNVKV